VGRILLIGGLPVAEIPGPAVGIAQGHLEELDRLVDQRHVGGPVESSLQLRQDHDHVRHLASTGRGVAELDGQGHRVGPGLLEDVERVAQAATAAVTEVPVPPDGVAFGEIEELDAVEDRRRRRFPREVRQSHGRRHRHSTGHRRNRGIGHLVIVSTDGQRHVVEPGLVVDVIRELLVRGGPVTEFPQPPRRLTVALVDELDGVVRRRQLRIPAEPGAEFVTADRNLVGDAAGLGVGAARRRTDHGQRDGVDTRGFEDVYRVLLLAHGVVTEGPQPRTGITPGEVAEVNLLAHRRELRRPLEVGFDRAREDLDVVGHERRGVVVVPHHRQVDAVEARLGEHVVGVLGAAGGAVAEFPVPAIGFAG
jgi:hypothetical protein